MPWLQGSFNCVTRNFNCLPFVAWEQAVKRVSARTFLSFNRGKKSMSWIARAGERVWIRSTSHCLCQTPNLSSIRLKSSRGRRNTRPAALIMMAWTVWMRGYDLSNDQNSNFGFDSIEFHLENWITREIRSNIIHLRNFLSFSFFLSYYLLFFGLKTAFFDITNPTVLPLFLTVSNKFMSSPILNGNSSLVCFLVLWLASFFFQSVPWTRRLSVLFFLKLVV